MNAKIIDKRRTSISSKDAVNLVHELIDRELHAIEGQIADFDDDGGQASLFGNECEGVCGV